MNTYPVSDSELISEVLAGNSRAYTDLIRRYQHMVYTLAVRMLGNREVAEETTQDVFVKVYKSLRNFRGDSKFSTWLYKVAYHRILDASGRESRQKVIRSTIRPDVVYTASTETTWNTVMIKERREFLHRILEQLSQDENAVLSLFYLQELSIREISGIMNLSQSAVKVRLFRAREQLKLLLENTTQGALLKTYI